MYIFFSSLTKKKDLCLFEGDILKIFLSLLDVIF